MQKERKALHGQRRRYFQSAAIDTLLPVDAIFAQRSRLFVSRRELMDEDTTMIYRNCQDVFRWLLRFYCRLDHFAFVSEWFPMKLPSNSTHCDQATPAKRSNPSSNCFLEGGDAFVGVKFDGQRRLLQFLLVSSVHGE